ncbi:hypothetical protein S245_012397, partial [Arachis hypogaea]
RKRLRRRYILFPLLDALFFEELSYKVKDSSTLLFLDEPTSGFDNATSYYMPFKGQLLYQSISLVLKFFNSLIISICSLLAKQFIFDLLLL